METDPVRQARKRAVVGALLAAPDPEPRPLIEILRAAVDDLTETELALRIERRPRERRARAALEELRAGRDEEIEEWADMARSFAPDHPDVRRQTARLHSEARRVRDKARRARERLRGSNARARGHCVTAGSPRMVPRQRESRPRGRRSSSRAGPSSSDDGPGEAEGDGEPSVARPLGRGQADVQLAEYLLRDVAAYLGRLGPYGAERGWLVDQFACLGYSAQQVGAALALAVSTGQARRGVDEAGAEVIWGPQA